MPIVQGYKENVGVLDISTLVLNNSDDGTANIGDIGFDFFYNGSNIRNSIVTSGNTFLNLGGVSEALKVCRRDARCDKAYTTKFDDFTILRWEGKSVYNSSNIDLKYEVFFYKDNTIVLSMDITPRNGTDDFNTIGGGRVTGFYPKKSYVFSPVDETGKAWEVYNDSYYVPTERFIVLKDNNNFMSYNSETDEWEIIPGFNNSSEMFKAHGVLVFPNHLKGISTVNPTLCIYEDETENRQIVDVKISEDILPLDNLIVQKEDYLIVGELANLKMTADTTGGGLIKVVFSVDNGTTWKSWDNSKWITIPTLSVNSVLLHGIPPTTVTGLEDNVWKELGAVNNLRLALGISKSSHTDIANITHIRLNYKNN